MENVWATVDRLIHDLGAIRAFVDQAEAVPDASSLPEVSSVRHAMDDATTAITRVFDDGGDQVIEAAWHAIARAQDAVRAARSGVVAARQGRVSSQAMADHARAQGARARAHAQQLTDQAARLRRLGGFSGPVPRPGDGPSED